MMGRGLVSRIDAESCPVAKRNAFGPPFWLGAGLLVWLLFGLMLQERPVDAQASRKVASGTLGFGVSGAVTLSDLSEGVVGVQSVGTFDGSLVPQATIDGTNWVATSCVNITSGAEVVTVQAAGIYQCAVAGFVSFRISRTTAGTANTNVLTLVQRGGVLVTLTP